MRTASHKVCPKCKEDLPSCSFNPDKSKRTGLTSYCRSCANKRPQGYWSHAYNRRKERDREKKKAHDKKYYQKAKDSRLVKAREYYARNSDKIKAYVGLWRKENSDKVKRYSNIRESSRRLRVPKWMTGEMKGICETFYETAHRLTDCLGIKFTVDHIHPLKGKMLSGLHVPWNLQILTDQANRAKGNKVDALF